MPLADHQFDLDLPAARDGCWWYAVRGRSCWQHGPFGSHDAALADLERRFGAWRRRARRLGGWAWRRSARVWVVTVPEGVEVPGLPLQRAPCTRHGGALPTTAR